MVFDQNEVIYRLGRTSLGTLVVVLDIETTGLNPYESKVILIGIKEQGRVRQWKLWDHSTIDEGTMIFKAIVEVENVYDTILGYNNLKFDVPFMLKRLEILGMSSPRFWGIHNKKWFDLYQFLGNDFRSLSLWLERAGIKRTAPDLDGHDIPIFFERKEYPKIEAHNTDDLFTSEALFLYLKKENPELLPFG